MECEQKGEIFKHLGAAEGVRNKATGLSGELRYLMS